MHSPSPLLLGTALAAALYCQKSDAEVQLPRVFGSHMVLQRQTAVPIWGLASPGEQVVVEFRNQQKTTTAGDDGHWSISLDPMPVDDPATMVIRGENLIELEGVLVGEVWVGSGQSNMDTFVDDYVAHDAVLAAAAERPHPRLRIYHSEIGDGWQPVTRQTLRRFSAQLFYFGVVLEDELDVPIGLMMGAVRGSPSARWIPDAAVEADERIQRQIAEQLHRHPPDRVQKEYDEAIAVWRQQADAARTAGTPEDQLPKKPWRRPDPGSSKGQLGVLYDKHIRPMQPYAIRGVLWDQGEGGADIAGVPQDLVMRALIRTWREDWGQGDFPWLYVQKPSGGGCALNPDDPVNLGCSKFTPLPDAPKQQPWDAEKRLEYTKIAEQSPATYMIPTSDLAPGVHPENKSGYATRAARVALGAVYDRPIAWHGPIFDSAETVGNELRVNFLDDGHALAVPPGQPLQGFAIAGDDRRFHWAAATIDGHTVRLVSPKVPRPTAARYAWDWAAPWANLFNEASLPARPFRTDDW